jgi:hypothetical protein
MTLRRAVSFHCPVTYFHLTAMVSELPILEPMYPKALETVLIP